MILETLLAAVSRKLTRLWIKRQAAKPPPIEDDEEVIADELDD